MSTPEIIAEEIDKQAALASAALQNISSVGTSASKLAPRAVLDVLGPYSAALYIAERVVQSGNLELVQTLHSRLLPLERMADEMLDAAKERGYFNDPDTGEPLRWLETCNEQAKDYMVALESMLDPQLNEVMGAAMDEHRRGQTVPLDPIH